LRAKNDDLNRRLIVPVPFDEVRIVGSLVYEVEKKTREKAEKESGKKVKRFDSNFFHFTIPDFGRIQGQEAPRHIAGMV
jgi:hypothetical protein